MYVQHSRRWLQTGYVCLLGAILLCACSEVNTPTLELLSEHYLQGVDEPSGLAYANGRLYAVSDTSAKIAILSADGSLIDQLDAQLETDEQVGLEAIAVVGSTAYLAHEPTGQIIRLNLADGSVLSRWSVDAAVDGNDGLEGLTVHDGRVLAVKEKKPSLLYNLDASGSELSRIKLEFSTDLSGLSSICSDRLLALSQEDEKLFELNASGELLNSWALPIQYPEGVAHDGGQRLYIVDELEAKLLVYAFTPVCDS
jgi:uncharacterized protein YjiK